MLLTNEKYSFSALKQICLQVVIFTVGMVFSFFLTDYYVTHLNPMRDLLYMYIFWGVVVMPSHLNPLFVVTFGLIYDVLMGLKLGWTSCLWVLWLMTLTYKKKKMYYASLEKKWLYFSVYFFGVKVMNNIILYLQTQAQMNFTEALQSFIFSLLFFPYVYFILNKLYFKWGLEANKVCFAIFKEIR